MGLIMVIHLLVRIQIAHIVNDDIVDDLRPTIGHKISYTDQSYMQTFIFIM